jgi:hypothetical protein
MTTIPIFIIVHNHYDILQRSLASYEKFIDHPKQFVFHNTNSVYQPTLDFLEERRKKGDLVYHTNTNHHLSVMNTVREYLSKHPDVKYYILTDPDIELNNCRGNLVETFIYLINKYNVYSVGTSLKIDDIPDYYPKKKLVLSIPTHKSFHSSPRIKENFEGQEFEITGAPIDTTFQLIRASSVDGRFPHTNCMRVFEPYDARHLDWYIDPNNMTDCQKFYNENATNISHWNNKNWNG